MYNVVRFSGNLNTTILDGFTVSDGLANVAGFLDGAGIYMSNNSSPIIQNCTFTNNSARFGGAITAITGSPKILNCKFINNTTHTYDGAAIWLEIAHGSEVVNCLFDGNSAQRNAGAIYLANLTNGQITNNTFVNNATSTGHTGAVFVAGTNAATSVAIDNCIFYKNSVGGNVQATTISYFQNVSLNVANSILEFGQTQISAQTVSNILTGDPMFVDELNGDYNLLCQSTAVNAGNSTGLNIPATDLKGATRIFGAAIDLGAYEVAPNQISATATETTICLGSSVTLTGMCDATGYTWSNGVTDGVPFSPTATQTYTCTGTSSGTSTQITITVVDILDETVSAPTAVCSGSSATVSTGGSVTNVNYRLEDGSGNVVAGPYLGTGNGLTFNTGPIVANTTFSVVGEYQQAIPNHALMFDGVNDEATTSYVHQSSSSFTIEMWVYPNSTSYRRILSNFTGGNTIPGNIIIDTYDATYPGRTLRVVFGGAGSAWSQHAAPGSLTLHAWNHVAVTFDNGTVYLYTNGVLRNTSTAPFTTVPTASAVTRIGADNPVGGLGFYNGGIDELRFWTTGRTANEITSNMNNCLTGTEPGLDLYYDFETTGTPVIIDVTGNSNGAISSSVDLNTAWVTRNDAFTCGAVCSLVMSQTATINIGDNTAPVADVATLTDVTGACSVTSLTAPTATDNCVGTITGTHNQTLPITANTVITWTYDDGNGNTSTQTQNVVLNDNTAPVANVASLPNLTAQCEITSLTAATDNCAGTITATHNGTLPFSTNQTITWTYDDGNGNFSSQTQMVVINDVTAPVADIVSLADVTAQCQVTSLTDPTATDNCEGTISGTHNATLPITTNSTITWTYDDGSGNTSTQTQNVVLNDNIAPIADITTLSDVTGTCSVTALTAPTATDNCEGTISGTHNAALPITTSQTITWTYADGSGNTSTQLQNIVIIDNTAPVADIATLVDVTGICSVTSLTAPTATDNCAGSITGTHNQTLPITSNTSITWTYDDGNGNTSTQTQNVVLNDNIAPVADMTTLTDVTGTCVVTALTAPTATDNCEGTISGTHNAALPITSNQTITWTYTDGSGNSSTQDQTIVITPVDASTSVAGITISANETNADAYQWVDCNNNNALISGETTSVFTPTTNGSYAVEVTISSCTVLSNCTNISTVSVDEHELKYNIILYPNPTSAILNIESQEQMLNITVIDITGKIVKLFTPNGNTIDVSNLTNGIYFLQIQTEKGTLTKKFIKE